MWDIIIRRGDKVMEKVLEIIGPTKNAAEGVAAIMKQFNVDEKTATKLLDDAITYSLEK